jgi:DNA-directed RNA polymerase specialized sigma24 family protein
MPLYASRRAVAGRSAIILQVYTARPLIGPLFAIYGKFAFFALKKKSGRKIKQRLEIIPGSTYNLEKANCEGNELNQTTASELEAHLKSFRRGVLSRREFEGILFVHLKKNIALFTRDWHYDEAMDFLSWFYPRLSRCIERYEARGYAFNTYLSALVKYSAKEYKRLHSGKRHTEACYWDCAAAEDLQEKRHAGSSHNPAEIVAEIPEFYQENREESEEEMTRNPRYILILLLKSYHSVTDEFLARIASRVNRSVEELENLVNSMKTLREEQDKRIWLLKQRIHSQYYRLMTYERRLSLASPDSARYKTLLETVSRHRERLANMRNRFLSVRKGATNQQVARVLGMPKGSVDSAIFLMKKKMAHVLGEEESV